MSTKLSLQDLLDQADNDYGSLFLSVGDTEVELRGMLQLDKAERRALTHLVDEDEHKDDDEDDVIRIFHNWAEVVAGSPEQADALKGALGERLAPWKTLQEKWSEATQPGEADPSRS